MFWRDNWLWTGLWRFSPTIRLQLCCSAVRSDKQLKPQKFKLKTPVHFFSPFTPLLCSHTHTPHIPHIRIHSHAERVNFYTRNSQNQRRKRNANEWDDLELNMLQTFSTVSHKVCMSKFIECSVYRVLYIHSVKSNRNPTPSFVREE